jgi:hypothetical protein
MQKELAQEIFTDAAAEIADGLVRQGWKNPFWVEVYDDRGLGFLCGFRMDHGKASEWGWRPTIEQSDFPVAMKLIDSSGEHRRVWVRGARLWTAA